MHVPSVAQSLIPAPPQETESQKEEAPGEAAASRPFGSILARLNALLSRSENAKEEITATEETNPSDGTAALLDAAALGVHAPIVPSGEAATTESAQPVSNVGATVSPVPLAEEQPAEGASSEESSEAADTTVQPKATDLLLEGTDQAAPQEQSQKVLTEGAAPQEQRGKALPEGTVPPQAGDAASINPTEAEVAAQPAEAVESKSTEPAAQPVDASPQDQPEGEIKTREPGQSAARPDTAATEQPAGENAGDDQPDARGERERGETPRAEAGHKRSEAVDTAMGADAVLADKPPAVIEAPLEIVAAELADQVSGVEQHESASAGNRADRPEAGPRPVMTAAWLRSMLNRNPHAITMQDGWQVMEMNLDGDQGTLTLKAKRDEDRMSVAVGLSDPRVNTMIQANAAKIEQVLQAQYETAVDLSFFSENAGHNERGRNEAGEPSRTTAAPSGPGSETVTVTSRRSHALGGVREWVG